jgi:hypothetical protein
MALRRRRIYEAQDARSSILARVPLRPDTLAQTVQFGSQTPLADGAGHTFHHLRGRYPVPLYESGSIVAPTRLRGLAVALVWLVLVSVRHGISRRGRPRYSPLLKALAVRTRDAEIVLGVLVEILRGDGVTANRGLAREANVALKNQVGATADSYIGAVAVKGLVTLRCSLLLWRVSVVAPARRALI